MKLWRRRAPRTDILATSGRSRLVRSEGRVGCICGYLCLATTEPCEFAGDQRWQQAQEDYQRAERRRIRRAR